MVLFVLGIFIVLAGIILAFVRPHLRTESKQVGQRLDGRPIIAEPHPNVLLKLAKTWYVVVAFGLFLGFSSVSWFYARQGHHYYVLTPMGHEYVVNTLGVKIIVPFSKVQEWEDYIDIKTVVGNESTDGIDGVINGGIPIRFIDQVTGTVSISVRMQIPFDDESFIRLVKEFRHPLNLVNNTLLPTVREQVINTGYMFAAQDYISGSAADFRQTLDEQLKEGGYSVEKKEFFDTTFLNVDIKQNDDRQIKDITTKYRVTKRLDKNGRPIRVDHDITKNNIIVSQVIVDEVILESAFRTRLEKQRDISAQKRIEMEMIETAKTAQQRIVAEGERDKAAERVEKEKDQVGALIAIETQKKQEVTKKELAELALQTARLQAQTTKVNAEAKRVELQLANGLSEEKKYMVDKEVEARIGVAKALAGANGITLPQMYMTGNGDKNGGNSNDAMSQLLMMMMAQQSLDKKK